MTVDEFDEPNTVAPGDRVPMDVFLNKLVIVRPVEYTDKMKTEYKPDGAEAVFVNIAIIDGYEGEPWKVFQRVLVMPGYLVGAFKNNLNGTLFGTIYHGQRKSGQKPPFMFQSLTDRPEQVAKGKAWLAEHRDKLTGSVAFTEPEKATADSMRQQANTNPYMQPGFVDEPPF